MTRSIGSASNAKLLHMVTFVLLLVGGLNWGLSALGLNVVEMVLGEGSMLTRIVYLLVGVSAVVVLLTHKNDCKVCGK